MLYFFGVLSFKLFSPYFKIQAYIIILTLYLPLVNSNYKKGTEKFPCLYKLRSVFICRNVSQRVLFNIVYADLEVQMESRRPARAADLSDDIALIYVLPLLNIHLLAVCVPSP